MFLLKRIPPVDAQIINLTLHSTMFLLKPRQRDWAVENPESFTFHNVSIKTLLALTLSVSERTLHSTMFLLKPTFAESVINPESSLHSTMFLLKPFQSNLRLLPHTALHSTMFLLKQKPPTVTGLALAPLHSTMFLLKRSEKHPGRKETARFTFHNVSIKTNDGKSIF